MHNGCNQTGKYGASSEMYMQIIFVSVCQRSPIARVAGIGNPKTEPPSAEALIGKHAGGSVIPLTLPVPPQSPICKQCCSRVGSMDGKASKPLLLMGMETFQGRRAT